jgi:hypothetical protein
LDAEKKVRWCFGKRADDEVCEISLHSTVRHDPPTVRLLQQHQQLRSSEAGARASLFALFVLVKQVN